MEDVTINFELFVFAYLSSSFVMRDINPKNSKNIARRLGHHGVVIQFPPEMDENWVRYGLAKLGQISELPNWQRMLFCAYTTQLLHSTGEVCWNNKDSYFIWFEFVCRNSGQIASRRSWKRSCLGLEYTSKMLTVGSLVGAQLG